MKTTYAISTSNENHYKNSYRSALEEFEGAKDALKKNGDKDTVYLFELPEEPKDFEDGDYLIFCLENEIAKELKKEDVK